MWIFRAPLVLFLLLVQIFCVIWFLYAAYDIRLYPITEFGMIIHEFDPWFNYRAAEYMCEHGFSKFLKWYDYMSWYPIGRPIGTTTYPGMQVTAMAIRETMKAIPPFSIPVPEWPALAYYAQVVAKLESLGFSGFLHVPKKLTHSVMSVNDICCMMPPWFGSIASLFTGLMTYEASRSTNAAVIAIGIMAIIPAHLMRSVGGEFDNEAVAMSAICSTFWLWLRAVRTPSSWLWSIPAGISYIYMVLTWGGYIFVINMIGVHALMLVCLGRFNTGVHKAYTIFFVIGTLGAVQIPVVGLQPIRSLEQMVPVLVFLSYQVLAFCDTVRRSRNLSTAEFNKLRMNVFAGALGVLLVCIMLLYPMGYFGPLSARIRGLFVKHTKTGNPLVDSVGEHKPAKEGIYSTHLNLPLDYAFGGVAVCLYKRNNACYFMALYAAVAITFSRKMSRLVLICAPICTVACAVWWGFCLDFLLQPFLLLLGKKGFTDPRDTGVRIDPSADNSKAKTASGSNKGNKKKGQLQKPAPQQESVASEASLRTPFQLQEWDEEARPGGIAQLKLEMKLDWYKGLPEESRDALFEFAVKADRDFKILLVRAALSIILAFGFMSIIPDIFQFARHCHEVSRHIANPKVVTRGKDRMGNPVVIDDYYRGYKWIDANTPQDARVIAWWDYGYQITGIANRTSLADGNTWNHEHIATLGKILTSPEKKAWNSIRHVADYLLVWAGGGGDDLAKSPHLARIGNSVFPDHCGDADPRCLKFGFNPDRTPTPMMAESLLYKAVMHKVQPGVKLNSKLFKEVHTTRHGKMRVYEVQNVSQESKDWISDPANRVCDAPGSWYCVGQYPPAIKGLIEQRRNFAQIEDFNKKGQKSAYTKLIEEERAGKRPSREL